MKWYQSFRAKLVFTLFPIVAGVALTSIWIVERRFSLLQQQFFEQQFQNTIQTIDESRTTRFNALSATLLDIAQSPALVEGFKTGLLADARSVIEPLLREVARQRLETEGWAGRLPRSPPLGDRPPTPPPLTSDSDDPAPPNPLESRRIPTPDAPKSAAPPRKPRPFDSPAPAATLPSVRSELSQLPIIALIDDKGDAIISFGTQHVTRTLSPAAQTQLKKETERRSERFLHLNGRRLSDVLSDQQVGYILPPPQDGQPNVVKEIFVTPVRDPDTQTILGAVVLGLPLPQSSERALLNRSRQSNSTAIYSGILANGVLTSTTVPDSYREVVASAVSKRMNLSDDDREEIILPIGSVPYRLIYRVLNPESPFPHAVQVNLYSLAGLNTEIANLRTWVAEITGVALLASFGLIYLVSRSLSGPVGRLRSVAEQVGRGRFDARVPVTTHDEIGALSESFNAMVAGLAQKEKYRSVLDAVADPSVAQQLIENSNALGGEQREVSMLFCDIRGFTALTEQMPPEDVIHLVNQHMTALTTVAYLHGGTVDKFVGDLIMVLFGAPFRQPDDAIRAVRCALAMQHRRRELNTDSQHPLDIGIGVATGLVVAGCMGSDQRLNYTVLGHRVNLASRLCGLAGPGQVIIDDQTFVALPPTATTIPLQPARLKGLSSEVQVYQVIDLPASLETDP